MENKDKPAYPVTGNEYINNSDQMTTIGVYGGLTKREMFAMHAMTGLLSLYDNSNTLVPNADNVKSMSIMAVFAADELLKALENE